MTGQTSGSPAAPRIEHPRPPIVWLASFPKSGNTWIRAIVTALTTHRHLFQVDQLGSGSQPHGVGSALWRYGLDVRWLDRSEIDRLRTALLIDEPPSGDRPRLRKTHEVFRAGDDDAPPFPVDATRAAILVVRDPRDVVCSWAPFFGVTHDGAIDAISSDSGSHSSSPFNGRTAQPWGTWSSHAESWLADDVPFPVHLVRYEDLTADAVGTLAPVFAAIGLTCSDEELAAAVDQARFDRLREAEATRGFRETSPKTATFFRRGRSQGWRDELTDDQIADIETDHADWMARLGYELTTDDGDRERRAEARRARRRQRARPWSELPPHLGIEVRRGEIPEVLPGAVHPVPWIQTTTTATRVAFRGQNALLVENGNRATVQWEHDPDGPGAGDLSWLVQGWAVTLASLQRGQLSIHASTVRIGDEVVSLAGQPGAGKSTTSMGLRRRGHTLLIDDTTLLEFRDGAAWTTPYSRNVHLRPDAADAMGLSFESLTALGGRSNKAAFLPEDPPGGPHRIDRVVVLSRSPDAEVVRLTELRGGDRLQALARHVSRTGLSPAILGRQVFFERLALLADSTRVQLLVRPTDCWTLDEVMDSIERGRVDDFS